jgi:hypothetical protein
MVGWSCRYPGRRNLSTQGGSRRWLEEVGRHPLLRRDRAWLLTIIAAAMEAHHRRTQGERDKEVRSRWRRHWGIGSHGESAHTGAPAVAWAVGSNADGSRGLRRHCNALGHRFVRRTREIWTDTWGRRRTREMPGLIHSFISCQVNLQLWLL